jgi:cellulose synthase/poly-beta-1,6-N-acetylglucosamine synthase-like glycosyltransferase
MSYIAGLLQFIIGYHLVFPLILFVIYRLSRRPVLTSAIAKENDYAIIVTAYEETHSLPAVVNSLLALDYRNYLIYVVADKCDISNLHFNSEKVVLLRPEDALSGNTRSHFYAISHFKRAHTHLTIIDSDNLAHPSYLKEIDVYFNAGFKAVQGVREAKNLDTTYACLDAARDIYYHFYDGKVSFNAGSSATLAGSGMAFTTELYKECLGSRDVSGAGFDKVLQAEIVGRGLRIAFAEKAIVFDEKTSHADQLVNQRSRWINTWFKYFSFGFSMIFKGIRNFDRNQFLFGAVLLRPPLFIFLVLSVICLVLNAWFAPMVALVWLIGLMAFVGGFGLALRNSDTNEQIYKSLVNIPKFMFLQIISLFNAHRANSRSVATKHYHVEITKSEVK